MRNDGVSVGLQGFCSPFSERKGKIPWELVYYVVHKAFTNLIVFCYFPYGCVSFVIKLPNLTSFLLTQFSRVRLFAVRNVFLCGNKSKITKSVVFAVSIDVVYLKFTFIIQSVSGDPNYLMGAALLFYAVKRKRVYFVSVAIAPLQYYSFSLVAPYA